MHRPLYRCIPTHAHLQVVASSLIRLPISAMPRSKLAAAAAAAWLLLFAALACMLAPMYLN